MNVLEEAQSLVHGKRNQDYGHPNEDFGRTAKMWASILGVDVSAEQVARCMIALKLSRECHKHTRDNLVDIAGYAATIEMLQEEQKTDLP